MKTLGYGAIPAMIEQVLREHETMITQDMLDLIPVKRTILNTALRRMNKRSVINGVSGVRRVYIVRWTESLENGRYMWRQVWKLGDRPNAPRPKAKVRTDIARQWRHRTRAKTKMNFVFNIGAMTL